MTKINCLAVKKLLSFYLKNRIFFKQPNDLLVDNSKICGILQETLNKSGSKYLIVGVGINLINSPNIDGYPTTNLFELLNKKISKKKIENEIKKIFEFNLNKFCKIR